jgi:antitoxin PrlF
MPNRLEAESTLTDRYQTTIPETVRRALRLNKRDKLRYTVRASGEVVVTRVAEPVAEDPALDGFLRLLERDFRQHPERLTALDGECVGRWQALAHEVELDDLDGALPQDKA